MNVTLLVVPSLWFFSLYHLLVGVPAVLSLTWLRRVGSLFYKLKIAEAPDPQFEYALKPLGLYAIFVSLVSVLMAVEATAGVQRGYLLICAVLLISRGVCRLTYQKLFIRAFGTTSRRNRANAALTFVLGAWFVALFLTVR